MAWLWDCSKSISVLWEPRLQEMYKVHWMPEDIEESLEPNFVIAMDMVNMENSTRKIVEDFGRS
jgi:hypothetical protein